MATIEVLLREDVVNLGHRGQIVRVKSGYARNYLLPRKLAMVATSANLKGIEQERKALLKREVTERHVARTLAERLQGVTLEFERKASEQGVFYGSVTTHDIAHALAEQGLEIERRKLHLESPIKQPGTYSVSVKLYRDVVIDIPVTVQREGEPEMTEDQAVEAPSVETPGAASAQEPADADVELAADEEADAESED